MKMAENIYISNVICVVWLPSLFLLYTCCQMVYCSIVYATMLLDSPHRCCSFLSSLLLLLLLSSYSRVDLTLISPLHTFTIMVAGILPAEHLPTWMGEPVSHHTSHCTHIQIRIHRID